MNVIVSKPNKAIAIPYSEAAARCMPTAATVQYNGTKLLAVRHDPDAVTLLRNLGIHVPEPIRHYYDWPGPEPFEAQIDTAAMLTGHPRAYVLNDMGTGKTRSVLYAYDYLRSIGYAKKMLVIAPLSTLTVVWEAELFQWFPHLSCVVAHGAAQRRLKMLALDKDIYIINHDGIKLQAVKDALAKMPEIDTIVIDELAVFRTQRTERWKALRNLLPDKKYVWGLTGQPTPNAPTDAWAQCRLITPDRVPKSFLGFRDKTMFRVSQFIWKPRNTAAKVVHDAMQPSVRFKRDDCVDLPPVTFTTREVPMTAKQTVVENALIEKFKAQFLEGRVTAANEGVKVSKLLQVSSGFVYLDDGRAVPLPNTKRMTAIEEMAEEAAGKVIFFAPYIALVGLVADYLEKKGYKVARITGATSKKARDEIFRDFQHTKKIDHLVAHPQTMAHGVTLTAANTVCWTSPPPSLEIYDQANARVSRPGQTRNQLIAHIQSSRFEKRAYTRLSQRASLQGLLLDMFQGVQHE